MQQLPDVLGQAPVRMHGCDSHDFFDMGAEDSTLDAMLRGMNRAKQRTQAWFDARKSCCLTGSALSNLLFFDTESEMIEWREQQLGMRPKKKFEPHVLEKMSFGRKHEDNAVAALMYHLRGSGLKGYWDAGFCQHQHVPIGASPDGVLYWPNSRPSTDSKSRVGVLEMKVSCSDKPYSAVPYYYIPQMLFEQRCLWSTNDTTQSKLPVDWCLFSCWSVTTQKAWWVPWSPLLWNELYGCVVRILVLNPNDAVARESLMLRLQKLKRSLQKFAQSECHAMHPRGGWPQPDHLLVKDTPPGKH